MGRRLPIARTALDRAVFSGVNAGVPSFRRVSVREREPEPRQVDGVHEPIRCSSKIDRCIQGWTLHAMSRIPKRQMEPSLIDSPLKSFRILVGLDFPCTVRCSFGQ